MVDIFISHSIGNIWSWPFWIFLNWIICEISRPRIAIIVVWKEWCVKCNSLMPKRYNYDWATCWFCLLTQSVQFWLRQRCLEILWIMTSLLWCKRSLLCLAYYVHYLGWLYSFAALGHFLCGVGGHALMILMISKFLLIFEHLFVANRTSIDINKSKKGGEETNRYESQIW